MYDKIILLDAQLLVQKKQDAGDYVERSIKYLWPHRYVMHA